MSHKEFTNYPPELSLEDYDKAISLFCEENQHAKAIYIAGTVRDPGISDLDFLVVGDEPKISSHVKEFLCGGNVLVMPPDTLETVNYLEKLPLRKLYGPEITIQENQYKEYDAVEIIEWLPERILLLESLVSPKECDVRKLLQVLKSVDRSISNVEKYLQIDIQRVDTHYILKNYMDIDIEQASLNLLESAREAWEIFESNVCLFTGEVLGKIELSTHYHLENRFPLLIQYLSYISSIENNFTSKLREFLNITGQAYCTSNQLRKLTQRRMCLLDRIYTWFVDHHLNTGMVKYGWVLKG